MTSDVLTENQRMALAVLRTMTTGDRNRAIVRARATGLSVARIAEAVGLSEAQVFRILQAAKP